ncbi:MAG: hypothetical protein GF418_06280 [Chitinivibrionales bacterium]|nr:hypothetical protein [Chitinivibrionales bacterium]MBD3395218.1 hypothetical protein [Chitinivibrionales bacterium]
MVTRYEKFDLPLIARRARNYITSMVDEALDYLPYWFIQINESPAYARHVRVDDAELVASWYEAIVALRHILGEDGKSRMVEEGFKRHLMKSWGPKGLRYHEDYPWSNTNHASFHEAAYVLSALNRLLAEEPDNREAQKRAREYVRGLRGLVIQRTTKTFWSGDFAFDEKVYEFPGDVYLRDGGFVPGRVTGRGEEPIRNAMMLHALAIRAERFGDEVALDLAEGLANHLLGLSRYFNWRGEFFGHVHSALWFAAGLARLSRLADNEFYVSRANEIFSYMRSQSSSFGWVPEFAQWQPPSGRVCETCCIKDMIELALELIDNGGYDYWDVVDSFTRNHLAESQIQDGRFISEDNTRQDAGGHTWKHMSARVVGGFSGGSLPNSISLSRFRSIAGCCVGTAPQVLQLVWERIVERWGNDVRVNLPMEKDADAARVEIGYPNDGYLQVTAKAAGNYRIRAFEWMGTRVEATVNGRPMPLVYSEGCLFFPKVAAGDVIRVAHALAEERRRETVTGIDFTVSWRGPDVVSLDPNGAPLQLYQRLEGVEKQYPKPAGTTGSGITMKPTEQSR